MAVELKFHSKDLILNDITYGESLKNDERRWQDYKITAMKWLNDQFAFLLESDLIEKYNTKKTIKEILEENKEQYMAGHFMELKEGKREQIYFDIWALEPISPLDSYFPFFFAGKLSHLDLLEVDSFLNFHFEENYENNKEKFLRFLTLTIRRYHYLLETDTVQTIQEWISLKEKTQELSGTNTTNKTESFKGRPKREAGDNRTVLSAVQTALLIQYLQKTNMILGQDYLNFKQAGEAFHVLTGFSPDSLRQGVGTKGATIIKNEDYKELHDKLLLLAKTVKEKA